MTLFASFALATPKLNSLTSADAVIFLDFDGHYVEGSLWNNGQAFACEPSALSVDQIIKVFHAVAEDFRPFNINITTDSSSFINAPFNRRIRIIITPTSSWRTGVSGISFIGSFIWGDDTPGFVFSDRLNNNTKFIAECCAHESGHTLGLAHQSNYDGNCNMTETYHSGYGNGETGWAPIMGNSYHKNMTGWNNGATPYGCNNTQDNLALIAAANSIEFRSDDYSDLLDNNTNTLATDHFSINGIITATNDKDAFKFTVSNEKVLQVNGAPNMEGSGSSDADLDIRITLYNESHVLIKTFDPLDSLGVYFETYLKTGTYYMVVDGIGNQYAGDYGSLGSYLITGTFKTPATAKVELKGKTLFGNDILEWNTIANEDVISEQLELSYNGVDFTNINVFATTSKTTSLSSGNYPNRYYRVKSILASGTSIYSNVVRLINAAFAASAFEVATLIHSQMIVYANQQYSYFLSDMNGRIILKGNGYAGSNISNVSSLSSGTYILTLIIEGQKTSRRILKQ